MGAYAGSREAAEGHELSWRASARCAGADVDPRIFFADDDAIRSIAGKLDLLHAKQICLTDCPVRDECLEYALGARIDDGVWGGMDPKERRRLLRQRRKAVA